MGKKRERRHQIIFELLKLEFPYRLRIISEKTDCEWKAKFFVSLGGLKICLTPRLPLFVASFYGTQPHQRSKRPP